MPVLRVLLAGMVALFALLAVTFTAVLVLLAGLFGAVGQLFRRPAPRPGPPPPARPAAARRPADDIIDVESTPVRDPRAGP